MKCGLQQATFVGFLRRLDHCNVYNHEHHENILSFERYFDHKKLKFVS